MISMLLKNIVGLNIFVNFHPYTIYSKSIKFKIVHSIFPLSLMFQKRREIVKIAT